MAITDVLKPSLMLGHGFEVTERENLPVAEGVGLREFPYIYVYDATGLTNGTSPNNLVMPIQADGDFAIRRMFGLGDVAAKIQLRQWGSGKKFHSGLAALPNNVLFPHEIVVPRDGALGIDLGTVAKGSIGCGGNPISTAYLGFQGVKYLPDYAQAYRTPFEFKRLPFTYTFNLTLDWKYYTTAPTVAAPKTFWLQIKDYDFEFQMLRVRKSDGTIATDSDFAIKLYDPYRVALSNAPVLIEWLNGAGTGVNAVFPVPGLLYPVDGLLQFDIQSFVCNTAPDVNYVLEFVGMQRYPLAG